jgi:hypothetical protein
MLDHLRSQVTDSLANADQTDLHLRHELTTIEDEAMLSGADSDIVRRAFSTWVAGDLTPRLCDTEKYGGTAEVRDKLVSNTLHAAAY